MKSNFLLNYFKISALFRYLIKTLKNKNFLKTTARKKCFILTYIFREPSIADILDKDQCSIKLLR